MDEHRLVLLVEDDPTDERLALRALSRAHVKCKVEVAHDGVEAVEYLLNPENSIPDLVLLDLKLPRMNGQEVLTQVRADPRLKKMPVVCFSSSAEPRDVCDCFNAGANSFVRKAVDYEEYMERLAKIADYWFAVNERCVN